MSIKELARHSRTVVVDGQTHVTSTMLIVQRQRDEIGFVIRQPGQDGPVRATEVILSLNADELEMLRGCLETGLKARAEDAEAKLADLEACDAHPESILALSRRAVAAEARVRELCGDDWDDFQRDMLTAARGAGATSERAAIVAWLRSRDVTEVDPVDYLAAAIESGAHIPKEGE